MHQNIIATNVPLSFSIKDSFKLVQLGDGTDNASAIIIMLDRIFGGGSIDKLDALTHWISQYNNDVPCYLVGCETTIPDENFQKYEMPERDRAIRRLCDEVLRRSKSIGVRGELTRRHLTHLIGYPENQVDIIYDSENERGQDRLTAFLSKNGCQIVGYEEDMVSFQRHPHVDYRRPLTFDRSIVISRPRVEMIDRKARLSAEITIDGSQKTLWSETQDIYRQFLLVERSDAFVSALIPLAIRSGKNIVCEAPVTEQFLHNLNEILLPQICAHDSRLYHTQIFAPTEAHPLPSGNAVATGMSCGVDSLYTTSLYLDSPAKSMNLTHLYTGNYIYGNESLVYTRAERIAEELGLPLVRTGTNINEELGLPHLQTHFFKTMFGVLSLRKLFRTYYYSTAEDFSHFTLASNGSNDTALYELLLLYTFSCSDFQLITGGARSERPEKTRELCNFAPARKYLNVCLHPEKPINCGKCEKCVRTLLTIDRFDCVEAFGDVFDVEDYKQTRIRKFVYLVEQKGSPMLAEVYQHFLSAEPHMMAEAEAVLKTNFDGGKKRAEMLKYL